MPTLTRDMTIKSNEDYERQRNKQVAGMRSMLDYAMGVLIIFVGVFLIVRHKFDLALNKRFPPDIIDLLLGILFVIYGVWRVYRGYKKNILNKDSMQVWRLMILGFVLTAGLLSCGPGNGKSAYTDTPVKGTITISADESFKPIVDALIQVYESNNDSTKINVQYKPESECIKDLWNDSIRMIISTVKLTDAQVQSVVDSIHVVVKQLPIARDAVAVIANPASKDTLLTMAEIQMILKGTYNRPLVPVLDGLKSTSTIRFLVDSVLKGQKLTDNAKGANTSDSVINYVANMPNAIGFIGVSWIGNQDDARQLSFLKKVKIVQLESSDKPGKYVLPVQANIYTKRYPMTRDLTYILKEGHRGLGTGFADFMSGEIGQLIFKKAYLMPGRRNFIIRPAETKE